MIRPGTRLWHRHPAFSHGPTFGEKAADWLKHWFGTWTALGLVAAWIAAWIALQRTSVRWDLYPFILLNLCLSCLAAVQGIILQISANRSDKVSAVISLHTEDNTDKLTAIARHVEATPTSSPSNPTSFWTCKSSRWTCSRPSTSSKPLSTASRPG